MSFDAKMLNRWYARSIPFQRLARIDKPIGTYLLYWPCTWSILLAASSHSQTPLPPSQTLGVLGLFGVGALVMRGAGCTINDLWDQDVDNRVLRTRTRPLAARDITVPQAVGFLGFQLSIGLAILTRLNPFSIALGAASLPLVAIYPYLKRITYYPQAVLGLAFNWGALLGYTAMTNSFPFEKVLPLYSAGICWTLIYDTLYAHQDKRDDIIIGIKSTALAFGDRTKPILSVLSLTAGTALVFTGIQSNLGLPFYIGATASIGNMMNVIWRTDLGDQASCAKAFKSSSWAGAYLALGLALEYVFQFRKAQDSVIDDNVID